MSRGRRRGPHESRKRACLTILVLFSHRVSSTATHRSRRAHAHGHEGRTLVASTLAEPTLLGRAGPWFAVAVSAGRSFRPPPRRRRRGAWPSWSSRTGGRLALEADRVSVSDDHRVLVRQHLVRSELMQVERDLADRTLEVGREVTCANPQRSRPVARHDVELV